MDDGGIDVGTFFQFNTFSSFSTTFGATSSGFYRSFGFPAIYTTVPNSITKFYGGPLIPNSPFTVGMATYGYVLVPSLAAGTYTFGFVTPGNQAGWIRMSFDPVPGAITYLAAAYNTTPGAGIIAGSLAEPIPESSTTMAFAGLATLATGIGVRKLRKRKAAKQGSSATS